MRINKNTTNAMIIKKAMTNNTKSTVQELHAFP